MKLLVTGGSGFIGSNYIRYVLKHHPEFKVVNLDLLTYAGNIVTTNDFKDNKNYKFVEGDIKDFNLVNNLFLEEKFDYVLNFAAESHVDRSIENPGIFIETNIQGTQVLLEAAKKYGIKKFLQVSTDEVYGTLGEEGLFTENTPLAPNSPYSASKASADFMVRAYSETYNLPINITRCSNNYGPYQYPEKLIPLMISNSLSNVDLPVYGDGKNIRDWLHVEDHCSAIDLVLHKGQNGEAYNIGGNNEKTNIEVVKTILLALDKPLTAIKYVQDRLGHDRRYAIDASKIRNQLGWKPKYDFESGIKETILWYKENRSWCSEVSSK